MNYFDGKVVLITGAGGGLGAELVRQRATTGARLLLTDVGEAPTPVAPAALGYIRANLGTEEGCRHLASECLRIAPQIDILINNAGLASVGIFSDIPDERWQAEVHVNLIAPMMLTKLFLPAMIARRSGHIVFISSVGGHVGLPRTATYAATKFGLRGFGTALHGELMDYNVSVSNVYPIFTRTPILDSQRYGQPKTKEMPGWLVDQPANVIRRTLEGIAKQKLHIFPSSRAWVMGLLARLSPDLVAFLARRLALVAD